MAQNFLVSPGINVTEFDLTNIIPSVPTTIGAIAGVFRWGPLGNTVLCGSANDVLFDFLPPTNFNAETWFSCANFLAYSQNLQVSRAGTVAGNTESFTDSNANTTTGNTVVNMTATTNVVPGQLLFFSNSSALVFAPGKEYVVSAVNASSVTFNGPALSSQIGLQLVFRDNILYNAVAQENINQLINWAGQSVINPTQYLLANGNFDSSVNYVSRYPGYAGNSLRVAVCDNVNSFSSNASLQPNALFNAAISVMTANIGSNVVTFTIAPANTANATMVTAANLVAGQLQASLIVGDKIQVGNSFIGFQFMQSANISSVANTSNVFSFTVTATSVYKLAANSSSNSLQRFWEFSNLFDGPPKQSQWQLAHGNTSAFDELHIVVVDQNGTFRNTPGLVLETYAHLSRGTDSQQVDGGTNYYKEVINKSSQVIWWANDRTTATSNTALLLQSSTATHPFNGQLYGGGDGPDETSVPLSTLTNAYGLFVSPEDITVSLLLQGKARGSALNSNADLGNWLIDNIATARKDCVAFISPDKPLVVNNIGFEAASIVSVRQNSSRSSSYGFFDSGYKSQYDPYNDVYRWIPLNADIAGLAAQTDQTRAPWWPFAGFNRGQIKNIVKLAWNPKQADRDALYSNGINPVVNFPGQGPILYGDKTMLSAPSAFSRINVRRLFIVLETAIKLASQFTLFEFNDDFTRAQFKAMVNPYLASVQGQRGIYNYFVVCDTTNNPAAVIDANQFVGDIYIQPAKSINFIQLNFVAVGTGVTFSTIVGQFGGTSSGAVVSQ